MDNTITITPSGISIASPLVAGTQLSVTATDMEVSEGATLFLIVTSRFPDLLVASCPLSETTTEGEYAGILYTATREMSLFLANARADEARPASIELVDTAHGSSLARTTVPIYNSSLIPQPCKWPSASPLYVPGRAATVLVGSTTTLPPGSSASVENAGTSSDAVLNFGIPRGDKGDAATVAVGTTQTLQPGSDAAVTNGGTSSAAVFNFGIPRGDKGDAATVAVGTTTTLAPGSDATVTNSGTASAAILNFGIPKGDKGDKGDPQPSDADPLMDGAASPGASADFARSDHTHPTSRNILRIATASSGVALAPETAVYRSSLNADGTFPAITATGIPSASAYYDYELELMVPRPVPAALTGPSGWKWLPGKSLPDPDTLRLPATLHVACRMDCSDQERSTTASFCWTDGPVDVQYVQSNRKQWIDTGIVAATPCRIEMRFAVMSAVAYATLFGVNQDSVRITGGQINVQKTQLGIGYAGTLVHPYTFAIDTPVVGVWQFDPADTSFSIDGVVQYSGTFEDAVDHSPHTIPLLCYNSYTKTNQYPFAAKIYYCKIWQGDGYPLVRDFVPVRDGKTGYLYDKISGNLFGSKTSTPLAAGPNK